MADTLLVPDASVLLKWVLRSDNEDHADRALALKNAWLAGACRIVVPTLWAFEVANVLGAKQPATADQLLGAMIGLRMPEEPPATYGTAMFRLMQDFRVTAYDAAYHGLALVRGGVMLTADRRYAKKAAGAGHIRLIDDWLPPSVAEE
jgi:predicted nucleic acid-binding protein